MAKTRPLYIMVSQTDTQIAKLIRAATHYPYNHVSVTLDPDFGCWYSFARYAQDAPLYGGFIRETPARLLGSSGQIHVRIFRVDVPEISAVALEAMIPLANQPSRGLIYNHFDAVASAVGIRIPVPNCHTCLSFACSLLGKEYPSIEKLCKGLASFEIFEGPLADLLDADPTPDTDYCTPIGLVQGSCRSAALLGTLFCRTIRHGFDCYRAYLLRRTAQ